MSDMDRREFLSKTAMLAGGVLTFKLPVENLSAEDVRVKADDVAVDEDWIGGF
jgi:hypothetical protein